MLTALPCSGALAWRTPKLGAVHSHAVPCHTAFMSTAPAARYGLRPARRHDDDTTTTTFRTHLATSARKGDFVNAPAATRYQRLSPVGGDVGQGRRCRSEGRGGSQVAQLVP